MIDLTFFNSPELVNKAKQTKTNTYHFALYSFFALLSTCYFSRKNNCITTPCCQLMNKSIRFFIVFLQRLKLRMIFFFCSVHEIKIVFNICTLTIRKKFWLLRICCHFVYLRFKNFDYLFCKQISKTNF
jgi:hypothetical protein